MSQSFVEIETELEYKTPFDIDKLIGWIESRSIESLCEVSGRQIVQALKLDNGSAIATLNFSPASQTSASDTGATVSESQVEAGRGYVRAHFQLSDHNDLDQAIRQCRHFLDLDHDPEQVDQHISAVKPFKAMVDMAPGLRIMGAPDGFAMAIFTVISQQRSLSAARTISARVVQRLREIEPIGDNSVAPFPSPGAVLEADLSSLGTTTRNIDTIKEIAKLVEGKELDLNLGADIEATKKRLLAIKGVGPWTADYLAMRALRDTDIWLPGDLVARRSAEHHGVTDAQLEATRPWRSYSTHYLWVAASAIG